MNEVVLSESSLIAFQVQGQRRALDFEGASRFVKSLLRTADKASLLFTEIVASRCTITRIAGQPYYEHTMQIINPLDAHTFWKLITFPSGISNKVWTTHLKDVERQVGLKDVERQVDLKDVETQVEVLVI